MTKKTEFADNMITIGALNFDYGDKSGSFLKHWKSECRCFCTRRKIYATTQRTLIILTRNNGFSNVAGVAAIIRSYYQN
jgi:hypothetical protein